uniref:Trigger factor n=1 Tax=Candidatus Kentrum sp. LFY TaxID=2126342 RepID=A0A450U6E8_9GAMM|nr:MAG: trigger factor [Candidatus Kentron sp. LFY]
MHVTVDITDDVTEGFNRRMRVEIPEDRIENDVNEQLRALIPTTRVPGFRPGKVPLKVLARRYGRDARSDVVNKLIYSTFQETLARENLHLANDPDVREINADPGKGLTYTAVFDVYPEVDTPIVETLEIRRPVVEITEQEVDEVMETLRARAKTWFEIDRPAAEGDRVIVDFEGVVTGKPEKDTPLEDTSKAELLDAVSPSEAASPEITKGSKVPVELGTGKMIDGFEEGLIGASAGEEKTLDLKFPDGYFKPELAGCPATFTVKVQSVEEGRLPDTDEDFARYFGIQDGNMDAFRAATRKDMENKLETVLRRETNRRVIDALLASNPIPELPKNVVTNEANVISEQKRREFAGIGIDPDKLGIDPSKFKEQAQQQITLNLLLNKLVSAGNIIVDPDNVRKRLEAMASEYQNPEKMIAWYYSDEKNLMPIKMMVLQDRVVDWVLERANVTEEQTSFDALLNPRPPSDSNPEADTKADIEADTEDNTQGDETQ